MWHVPIDARVIDVSETADPQVLLSQLRPGRFRVVRIIARLNVGGPARHVLHLARGLKDYPTLLITGDVDAGESELPFDGSEVTIFRIPELGRRVRVGQDLIAFWKILRLLLKVRPEIVHTHTAKAGTLGRLAALLARVPVRVHTFHGHVFAGYFKPLTTRLVILIERFLALTTTRIITISEQQAGDITTRFRICPRDRVRVVPLGLELDDLVTVDRAQLGAEFRTELQSEHTLVVTVVGRLVPIKHHELLLRAARTLHMERDDFTIAFVGDGSERTRLEQLAAALGLSDRVRFLGWRNDLDRIYAGSDVVVLTSRNEGTPVCLIEALAAGVPVIATDVGGVRHVVTHNVTGLLIADGDEAQLVAALTRLLDDDELRTLLGRNGQRDAPLRFSLHRLLGAITELYDDEIAMRTAPRPAMVARNAPSTATAANPSAAAK